MSSNLLRPGRTEASLNFMQFVPDVPLSTAKTSQKFTNLVLGNGDKFVEREGYIFGPFVDVHWHQLLFTLATSGICFAVLLITMYQTHRARIHVWKISPLPLILDYNHDQLLMMRTTPGLEGSEHTTRVMGTYEERAGEATTTGVDAATICNVTVPSARGTIRNPDSDTKWIHCVRNQKRPAGEIDLRLIVHDKRWSFERQL